MKFKIFSIIILSLFLFSCNNSEIFKENSNLTNANTVICNPPYIFFEQGCCLDVTNNSICDKDETKSNSLVDENIAVKSAIANELYIDNYDEQIKNISTIIESIHKTTTFFKESEITQKEILSDGASFNLQNSTINENIQLKGKVNSKYKIRLYSENIETIETEYKKIYENLFNYNLDHDKYFESSKTKIDIPDFDIYRYDTIYINLQGSYFSKKNSELFFVSKFLIPVGKNTLEITTYDYHLDRINYDLSSDEFEGHDKEYCLNKIKSIIMDRSDSTLSDYYTKLSFLTNSKDPNFTNLMTILNANLNIQAIQNESYNFYDFFNNYAIVLNYKFDKTIADDAPEKNRYFKFKTAFSEIFYSDNRHNVIISEDFNTATILNRRNTFEEYLKAQIIPFEVNTTKNRWEIVTIKYNDGFEYLINDSLISIDEGVYEYYLYGAPYHKYMTSKNTKGVIYQSFIIKCKTYYAEISTFNNLKYKSKIYFYNDEFMSIPSNSDKSGLINSFETDVSTQRETSLPIIKKIAQECR